MPYMRGHVRHPNKDALMAASDAVHGPRLRKMAFQFPPSWDSWVLKWIPPIKNQSNCGSCWLFSGSRVFNTAMIRAGIWPADGSKTASEQWFLDCQRSGGCGGDDNVTVLDVAKKSGLVIESDYGAYTARSSSCKLKTGTPTYKLDDWGFCDGAGGSGVCDTDKIKAMIVLQGGVGSAVAATSSWDGYQAGQVHTGNSRSIDHDVFLSGWNDTGTTTTAYLASGLAVVQATGWWWMDNSWGTGWGEGGRMRIAYGADSIGTEAVWATIKAVDTPIDWSQI
jgi:C1A family cysteine protease